MHMQKDLALQPDRPRRSIRVGDLKIIDYCENLPVKQASLQNSACSLKERRAEPLHNLSKGYTERTRCGLPFDASYACAEGYLVHRRALFSCYVCSVHNRAPPLITYLSQPQSNP